MTVANFDHRCLSACEFSFQPRISATLAANALAANTRHEPVPFRQPVAGQSVLRLAHAGVERRQRREDIFSCWRLPSASPCSALAAAARGFACCSPLSSSATNDGLICNTIKHAVPARARSSRCRRRGCLAWSAKATSRRDQRQRRGHGGQQRQPQQHAVLARGQLVRRHDGAVPVLPAKPLVHAAAGARAFRFRASITACIIPATCWPARSSAPARRWRWPSPSNPRGNFRERIVSALARDTAVARAQLENRKLPIR